MTVPSFVTGWLSSAEAWGGWQPLPRVTPVPPYELHSVEFGAGEEPLILLHGLSGSSRWWSRNVPGLAERYRVLIPDLVGFGRSPAPRTLPSVASMADLLADWLTELGVQAAHLVGHSMGGQIAVHLAARYPERLRRLVLVDAAGIPRGMTPARAVRFAMELAPVWRWGDPRFVPTILTDALIAGPRSVTEAIAHILRDDVRPLLPRVQAPTLVIWGERDSWVPLVDATAFREQIPHARLAVLRGASHNPMVDRPADFNRLVLRFLQGESVGR